MKHYFSILLACAASTAFAQSPSTTTIINSTDVGFPGSQYVYLHDSIPASFNPGAAGTGWTLDFTTLATDYSDTIDVFDIAQTPYANQFPTADLVMNHSNGVLAIVSNAPGAFSVQEQINPLFQGVMEFHYTLADTVLQYSLGLNDTWYDTSAYYFAMYYGADPGNGTFADSMRIVSGKTEYNFVDGEGTCITEAGTYNCLRISTAGTTTDYLEFYQNGAWVSFGMISQAYSLTYTWWAKTSGLWVAQCEIEPSNASVITVSRLGHSSSATGMDDTNTSPSARVYPNPASNNLVIEVAAQEGSVELLDATGRVVKTAPVNGSIVTLNVTDLAPGIYFCRVNDIQIGKVQIQ